MARHRAGVAETEVDVLVPVHVAEARALRIGCEDREAAGPPDHPVHRNAAEQRPLRPLAQLRRARMLVAEPLQLTLHQLLESREGRRRTHGEQNRRV